MAQNVGIGTPTPEGRLHVVGSAGVGRSVLIDNREIKFRGDGVAHFSIFGPTTGRPRLSFSVSSSGGTPGIEDLEAVSIVNNGNVGIGTVAPAQRLHVQGTVRVSTLSHTDPYNRMVTATAAGDLTLGEAPYGFNVQSVTLTTTQTHTSPGTWQNLLSITFTPRHNRIFVFASFCGRLTDDGGMAQWGQGALLGRIRVGASTVAQAAQIVTDYDDENGVVTSGTVAFAGIPVNVTPGAPVTVTLQWNAVLLWAAYPWQFRIQPGVLGDHAVLTILD